MSLVQRRYVALLVGVGGVAAVALASSATADPDIRTESAAAVIGQLQQEGYTVQVNGVSSPDITLLSTCKVTQIHKPVNPTPDTTSPNKTVYVDVACPISHG